MLQSEQFYSLHDKVNINDEKIIKPIYKKRITILKKKIVLSMSKLTLGFGTIHGFRIGLCRG